MMMTELIITGFIIFFLIMVWVLTPPEIEDSIRYFITKFTKEK